MHHWGFIGAVCRGCNCQSHGNPQAFERLQGRQPSQGVDGIAFQVQGLQVGVGLEAGYTGEPLEVAIQSLIEGGCPVQAPLFADSHQGLRSHVHAADPGTAGALEGLTTAICFMLTRFGRAALLG